MNSVQQNQSRFESEQTGPKLLPNDQFQSNTERKSLQVDGQENSGDPSQQNINSQRDSVSLQFHSTGGRSSQALSSSYILQNRAETNEEYDQDGSSNIDFEGNSIREELISESQVRDIIKKFNECLNKHSLEKIDLERKLSQLQLKIEDKQIIVRKLYSEREKTVMDIEQMCLKLDQVTRNKELLEKNLSDFILHNKTPLQIQNTNTNSVSSDLIIKPVLINDSEKLPHMDEVYNKIELLEKKRQDLFSQNQLLRDSISSKYFESKVNETKCQNCKQYFLPLHNYEDSCLYHPGKLKFFSCRGCGADQYYNCCNKCTLCSKGCRAAKHLA